MNKDVHFLCCLFGQPFGLSLYQNNFSVDKWISDQSSLKTFTDLITCMTLFPCCFLLAHFPSISNSNWSFLGPLQRHDIWCQFCCMASWLQGAIYPSLNPLSCFRATVCILFPPLAATSSRQKTLCCNWPHSGMWKALLEFFFIFFFYLAQPLLIKLIRCALNVNRVSLAAAVAAVGLMLWWLLDPPGQDL